MKRIFYHGTSADNLPSILEHGLSCDESKLWNVSEDMVYLWGVDEIMKVNDYEEQEDGINEALRMAYESAQIACIASKDCRAVVIKIELDDTDIYADLSCGNMEGRGAVCTHQNIPPSCIVEIKVSNDLSMLKGYFIALMDTNEYFDVELTQLEKRIAKAFKNAEIYPEDIEEMTEWENVEIPQLA